jgi:predicted metalloprotease with PDZ domain
MSRLAPFVDAAVSIDRTAWPNLFISYYTYGSAIAMGLDLSLRDRSDGKLTIDGYMRALWRQFGRSSNQSPGVVPATYTIRDLESTLGEVSGDPVFAREFFQRYVEGRDVVDYSRLLLRAGLVVRKRAPGRAWIGEARLQPGAGGARVVSQVPFGSPLYKAGVAQDDLIVSLGTNELGQAATPDVVLGSFTPGSTIPIRFVRRGGERVDGSITLDEDPNIEIVPVESTGGPLTAEQKRFREAWLNPQ